MVRLPQGVGGGPPQGLRAEGPRGGMRGRKVQKPPKDFADDNALRVQEGEIVHSFLRATCAEDVDRRRVYQQKDGR